MVSIPPHRTSANKRCSSARSIASGIFTSTCRMFGRAKTTRRGKSARKLGNRQRAQGQTNAVDNTQKARSRPTGELGVGDPACGLGYRHVSLFLSLLLIYSLTAMPSIPGGDAGELLAEACHFGVPHPPGYPLLNLLHHALSRVVHAGVLQFPSPPQHEVCYAGATRNMAFAANVISGVFGSASAVMICLTTESWTHGSKGAYNSGGAAAGAILFGLSPLAWEYSTGTEVFALNNLLVAAALYLASMGVRRPSMNKSRCGALVLGLALSNQHASLLVLVPLAVSVMLILVRTSRLSWRSATEVVAFWLPLGLSPHATLWVSVQHPRQGSWGDLTSLRGFVRHVLREEYGTFRLGVTVADAESAYERLFHYIVDSHTQTTYVGPPLALLGLSWVMLAPNRASDDATRRTTRQARAFGAALFVAWLSYVLVWHGVLSNISLRHPMSKAVHARFWMQPNLLLCVAAGCGLGVVMNAVTRVVPGVLSSCFTKRARHLVTVAAPCSLPVALTIGLAWIRWGDMNRGVWSGKWHGWTMHLYGQAQLANLPARSLLLSHTDLDLNAARYLRVCEGFRQDVTHMSFQMMPYPWWNTVQAKLYPGVYFPPILPGVSTRRDSPGNAALVTRFLAANARRGRPIFLDMQAVDEREIGAGGAYRGFTLLPHGLSYRVLPSLTLEETENWHDVVTRELKSLQDCMRLVSRLEHRAGSWEFAAQSVYWDAHYQSGLFFLSYAVGVWRKGSQARQHSRVLPALRNASTLLRETLEAVDRFGTFSSSRADLLKNTVLAEVRLHHSLQLTAAVAAAERKTRSRNERVSLAALEALYAEMMSAKARCLEIIPRFLAEAVHDKDAEAFGRTYIKLRGDD